MRHRKKSERFSRSRAEKKALVKSLLRSVIINERIVTTQSKAKALRAWVDKFISWAIKGGLHHKRLSFKLLGDHSLVSKLFDNIGPRYKAATGGYTRVINLGYRKGDGALMSIIELTKRAEKQKKIKEKKAKEERAPKHPQPVQDKTEQSAEQEAKPKKGLLKGLKKVFKPERPS